MAKAVIFDRDGVILDSESTNIASAVECFKELGIKIKKEEREWIVGRSAKDYLKFFSKKYDFSYEDFIKIQKDSYYKHLESTLLFEDTISLIKKLHKNGFPLALTTSGGLNSTSLILKKANLEDIFNVIVTSENCKKKKPDPEPYLTTSKKLGIDPKYCVVVEDSYIGLESAKNAGMKCMIIPNKYTKKQDFSKADFIFYSANKITLKMLKEI